MSPSLTRHDVVDPRALVLVLHGGQPSSTRLVDGRSASWQRMAAVQRALRPAWRAEGVGSWLLRYRHRGWNGGHSPVDDARWALDQVRRELGPLPVVLLGHSMGGRVAVHVADDPSVAGVVALAPWWQASDPTGTLRDRRLAAAHGRGDRITSFGATASYVDRAARSGVDARLVDMGPLGHYMLVGARRWSDTARDLTLDLLGTAVDQRG